MKNNKNTNSHTKAKKRTLGTAFLFYFLIAFEFAYMAGPFAAYFYWAYNPALSFFNKSPYLSWLTQFFLPHVVQNTKSGIINVHNTIGFIIAIIGLVMFLVGACKIYYYKLTKKGAATGGIYKYIRHPQYVSFIFCSFGLLLIWPRFIVVVCFITMLFVYYFLARLEEKECLEKFGETYATYMNSTNRFIPLIKFNPIEKMKSTKKSISILYGLITYLLLLSSSLAIAFLLQKTTINSLYASYTDHSATISLCKLDSDSIDKILSIANSSEEVQSYLDTDTLEPLYLNHILPTEWFAAEVPMNGLEYRQGHKSSNDYDKALYKLIITEATVQDNKLTDGKEILTTLVSFDPLVEVWINIDTDEVIKVLSMPDEIKYQGIPEAIY